MAGHSQFKNIMHRKGAQDAKRAKQFAKLAREIEVAARLGAPDPDQNPRLRTAIQAARSANMPKDRIERAITKATGGGDDTTYEEVRYEGYGPGGVAVIVEALTDNRNRTAAEVRAAFAKFGGSLGETGSVGFLFDRIGQIAYPPDAATADEVFDAALEAGADDVASGTDGHTIATAPETIHAVSDELEKQFGAPQEAILTWKPQTTVALDSDAAQSMIKLLGVLEDSDDVQTVSANFEIADDVLAALAD